jgi:hypothetical protein
MRENRMELLAYEPSAFAQVHAHPQGVHQQASSFNETGKAETLPPEIAIRLLENRPGSFRKEGRRAAWKYVGRLGAKEVCPKRVSFMTTDSVATA